MFEKFFDYLGIPVWSGNINELPPEGEVFQFRGRLYRWEKCDCNESSCERPLVYSPFLHRTIVSMTYRMRGTNTGNPRINIMAKILGSEVVADIYDSESDPSARLVELANKKLASVPDKREFLQNADITYEEVMAGLIF